MERMVWEMMTATGMLIFQLSLVAINCVLVFALLGMKKAKDSLQEKNLKLEDRIAELISQKWELQ